MAYMITAEKAPAGESILKTGETIQQVIVETAEAARETATRWRLQASEAGIGAWVTIDAIDLR